MKSFVKRFVISVSASVVLFSLFSLNALFSDEIEILYHFGDAANDGLYPISGPIVYNGIFYGMTNIGGSNSYGVVFSLDPTDTSNYSILREFGAGSDGRLPQANLLAYNGNLFGMTNQGGTNGYGTIFSLDPTDTSNYSILHSFSGFSGGQSPYGNLIQKNGLLYGTTWAGGSANTGVIFSLDPTNTTYTVLHSFDDIANDGQYNGASLIDYNNKLWGMTTAGGNSDNGVIFSLDPSNTADYSIQHSFGSVLNDGDNPRGNLIVVNNIFYGMTAFGGDENGGIIFSLDPSDTSNYSILHNFVSEDGTQPYGDLFLFDGIFYGMTRTGGNNGKGIIFSMNTDGTNYSIRYNFTGAADSGANPRGGFTEFSNSLYAVAISGGNNNQGILFELIPSESGEGAPIPEPATLILFLLSFLGFGWRFKRKNRKSGN
ncbi:choice-of-anchor tandem repeat GloVer-containing protein [Chlamydiota bacterium]